eukprot:jgi/Undpi1/1834/HiC_scaffold_12.g05221.m1
MVTTGIKLEDCLSPPPPLPPLALPPCSSVWKRVHGDREYWADYKELAKPMKPPPHGLEWRRLPDGAWELRTVKKTPLVGYGEGKEEEEEDEVAESDAPKIHVPEFLEHVVMPEDTLTGICMRYKVKDRELRRLNGFIGNHFRMCDSLIVPNRFKAGEEPKQNTIGQEPLTEPELLQSFSVASKLGTSEAKYYLESNDWDLTKALKEWRDEKAWESEQKPQEAPPTEQTERKWMRPRGRKVQPKVAPVGHFMATSGTTLNSDYVVTDDGSVEMAHRDNLADARVPLLSAQAHR